jgi:hypothetical protein
MGGGKGEEMPGKVPSLDARALGTRISLGEGKSVAHFAYVEFEAHLRQVGEMACKQVCLRV